MTHHSFLRALAPAFAVLLLTACGSNQPPSPLDVHFADKPKIQLNVARLDFVDRTAAVADSPTSLTRQVRPAIAEVVETWARERFTPVAQTGTAHLVINEASVETHPIPLVRSFSSFFTREQAETITARVSIDMRIFADAQRSTGYATARSTRSTTLPEDASPSEREAAWNRLISGLIHDIDTKTEEALNKQSGLGLTP